MQSFVLPCCYHTQTLWPFAHIHDSHWHLLQSSFLLCDRGYFRYFMHRWVNHPNSIASWFFDSFNFTDLHLYTLLVRSRVRRQRHLYSYRYLLISSHMIIKQCVAALNRISVIAEFQLMSQRQKYLIDDVSTHPYSFPHGSFPNKTHTLPNSYPEVPVKARLSSCEGALHPTL